MPTRPRWKFAEDMLAKFFGTVRRPLSGGNSKSGGRDDAQHPRLFLSSKQTKKSSLWTLYREEKEKAKVEGKTCVLGIKEQSRHGMLLVIHMDDLQKVYEEYIRGRGFHLSVEYQCPVCKLYYTTAGFYNGYCASCWQYKKAEGRGSMPCTLCKVPNCEFAQDPKNDNREAALDCLAAL